VSYLFFIAAVLTLFAPVLRAQLFCPSVALEEFYAPHNARLYNLLGKDFGW
jgi:hypothetical protein